LPFGSSHLVDLHLLHRLLAYAVTSLVFVVIVETRRRGASPAVRATALLLGALVVAQLTIGAVGVSTGLGPLTRGLHLAGAAAVWSTTVALATLVTRLSASPRLQDTEFGGAARRLPSSDPLRG
jgi:heme A synthase